MWDFFHIFVLVIKYDNMELNVNNVVKIFNEYYGKCYDCGLLECDEKPVILDEEICNYKSVGMDTTGVMLLPTDDTSKLHVHGTRYLPIEVVQNPDKIDEIIKEKVSTKKEHITNEINAITNQIGELYKKLETLKNKQSKLK